MKKDKVLAKQRTETERAVVKAVTPNWQQLADLKKPIPASLLLRVEANRLRLLSHAVKKPTCCTANALAFELAATWLDSLGAPERLVRYVPAPGAKEG